MLYSVDQLDLTSLSTFSSAGFPFGSRGAAFFHGPTFGAGFVAAIGTSAGATFLAALFHGFFIRLLSAP